MNTHEAFLTDILADPDDDVVRLIYADWLREQDDVASQVRGEFIHVQCLVATGEARSDRARLLQRERELLEQHGRVWVRPVRRVLTGWRFERGFIEAAAAEITTLIPGIERLFDNGKCVFTILETQKCVIGVKGERISKIKQRI